MNCEKIKQIYVHGSVEKDYLTALIILNIAASDQENYPSSTTTASTTTPNGGADNSNLEMKNELKQALYALGKQFNLKYYEVPRAIAIGRVPFSAQNGMLTASLKLQRRAIANFYAAELTECDEKLRDEQAAQGRHVREIVASVLGVNDDEEESTNEASSTSRQLTTTDDLRALGMDSIKAMQIHNKLKEAFADKVS
jgi:acyl carrier protein